ncbi:MAG: hypothetical protein U0790_00885 [Isosphaeraceae bacterium]
MRSPDARVFAYHHEQLAWRTRSQGELLRKYRRGAGQGKATGKFRAYQRAEEEAPRRVLQALRVGRRPGPWLRCEHEKLRRGPQPHPGSPAGALDLQEMLSEGYRKLEQSTGKEAELSIHRHRKALEGSGGG